MKMQAFLSALSQIIATLLTVFLAALMAYFVFLRDRETQFSDQVETAKLEIRDRLLRLRSTWPWSVTMYFPPEFRDRYREKRSDKTGADLMMQAVIDFIFENPELRGTVDEVRDLDSFSGPWRGRVYFVILTEGVAVITVGAPDTRTTPEGVFPTAAQGPGFTQWKVAFNKLRRVLDILAGMRADMKNDFHNFVAGVPERFKPNAVLSESLYARATEEFFEATAFVGGKLHEIEKLELSKSRYSFVARVNLRSIATMFILAFILGVIVPLFLLALPRITDSPIMASALLTATLALVVGLFIQFGRDVSRPPEAEWNAYLAARWYVPLLKELERQSDNFKGGGLLDLDYFDDAEKSEDIGRFPAATVTALREYVKTARLYNGIAAELNERALKAIREMFGPLLLPPGDSRGGIAVSPYSIVDDAMFSQTLASLTKTVQSPECLERDISVEVIMPRWRRVVTRIPCSRLNGDPTQVTKPLEEIRTLLKREGLAQRLLQSRETVRISTTHLEATLRARS